MYPLALQKYFSSRDCFLWLNPVTVPVPMSSQEGLKESIGTNHFRPRYAWANLGHPSCLTKRCGLGQIQALIPSILRGASLP
jgi:hypothetical protein